MPDRTIIKAIQTCHAAPSQWDTWTVNGEYLYLRFRHGFGIASTLRGSARSTLADETAIAEFDAPELGSEIELDDFCRRAGLTLALTTPAEHRYLWPEQQPPGVWMVTWEASGTDDVTPYPTEIEALRAINGGDHMRAWFVPWGKSLHDLLWHIGEEPTDA